MTELLTSLVERLQPGERVSLQEYERHFPEVIDPFVPTGFRHVVRYGSAIRRVEDELDVELSLEFWPARTRRSAPVTCSARRAFNTADTQAHHVYLQIGDALQGHGIGRRLVRSALALYEALGIVDVDLVAMDIGRYAWAMCGFDPAPDVRSEVLQGINEAALILGFELEGLDQIEFLWDLDQIDEYMTGRELVETLGGIEVPAILTDDLDVPIRLGKALLLCSRTERWHGKLEIGNNPGYDQMMLYTDF